MVKSTLFRNDHLQLLLVVTIRSRLVYDLFQECISFDTPCIEINQRPESSFHLAHYKNWLCWFYVWVRPIYGQQYNESFQNECVGYGKQVKTNWKCKHWFIYNTVRSEMANIVVCWKSKIINRNYFYILISLAAETCWHIYMLPKHNIINRLYCVLKYIYTQS